MLKCTKAIIAVAGFGSRCLPVTKAVEKCMLPVANRPVVDYIVEDCLRAGVTDVYFVISRGGGAQLRAYYSAHPALEAYLRRAGKDDLLAAIAVPEGVTFHYIEQDTTTPGAPYGTSLPLWLCREYIEPDEHFLMVAGDDFFYHPPERNTSEASRLIAAITQTGGQGAAILGAPVAPEEVSDYGILATHHQDGLEWFDCIQEKPAPEEARGTLKNVSRYIFDHTFLTYVDRQMQEERTHEYYITDAINAYRNDGHQLQVVAAEGEYLDCGTTENWLRSNNYIWEHRQH